MLGLVGRSIQPIEAAGSLRRSVGREVHGKLGANRSKPMHQPDPQSRTFDKVLHGIETGTLKIPQFQRDFVWSRDKSAKLIDSILKGYPIGTFILWKTKEQLRFVKEIGGQKLPPTPKGDYAEQVLDGQQRLTSLYAACKGVTIKRDGRDDDFREIFVDLDADWSASTETVLVSVAPQGEVASTAADGQSVRLVDVIRGEFNLLAKLSEKRRERLLQYQKQIQTYQFSVILIQDAPIDVATEIFTRINVSGQSLSVFEIMVAKTYDHEDGFDLAERFKALQARLEAVDYGTIPPSAVLQLASLLMVGECQKQNILRLDTAKFREMWPRVEDAVENACDYFKSYFRVPVSKLLPYASLVVPLGYYFAKHKDPPMGDHKEWLRELFWRISLSGRYTSAVETKLASDIKRVEKILKGNEPSYDYGVDISPEAIDAHGYFNTGRSFIKSILCVYAFHHPESFESGAKVHIANDWLKRANSKNYHHFFPRAFLKKRSVPSDRINHVANITIVDDYLNKREIKAKAPSVYMKAFKKGNKQLADTMATHLIDPDAYGVWDDDYELFLKERCKAISKKLRGWVPKRPVDDVRTRSANEDLDPDDVSDDDSSDE
ncbi:MAG: DUF262 domain-containing protein [Planctomycetota bacterium]|nr:DUF262 domain-containing protein [Planctomycetota bacterium]